MALFQRLFISSVVVVVLSTLTGAAQSRPAAVRGAGGQAQPASAEQLFALANQARMRAGVGQLKWDPALADAAMKHCQRMTVEGPISHRYAGEPDLTTRTANAGARFSLIEENIAVGDYPSTIQQGWMDSPPHRENMLNRDVDHVGIAVVSSRGVLFAVADFSRAVPLLQANQVETSVAALIHVSGVAIRKDPRSARAACATDQGVPGSVSDGEPQFVMRWENSDLSRLPDALASRLSSGRYRQAAVGSCPARDSKGAVTTYRVAVLLY
jgi:uncharacterized protein YkwD